MADVAHDVSGPATSPKAVDIAPQQASRAESLDRGKLRVFISYSRDDLHFADQLDAALNAYSFGRRSTMIDPPPNRPRTAPSDPEPSPTRPRPGLTTFRPRYTRNEDNWPTTACKFKKSTCSAPRSCG